jgi:hypothetical protein
MIELAKAIVDKVIADVPLRTAIAQTGSAQPYGIYFNQAPEEAVFPYIVFTYVINQPRRTFVKASDIEEVIVRFSIYNNGSTATTAMTVSDLLRTVMDRQNLTYASYTNIGCFMQNIVGPLKSGPIGNVGDDEDYYQVIQDYRIMFNL